MHKKSLEMSKKCSSPSDSDSIRRDSFCNATEQRHSSEDQEAEPEEEEEQLLEMEEEDMEEEVAIDLSSSSKQHQQEVGSSIRPAPSPHQPSNIELVEWS